MKKSVAVLAMGKYLAIAGGILASSAILGHLTQLGMKTNAQDAPEGKLVLVANGEDFVRQGFMSKDGWQINFDSLDVNVSRVSAYQVPASFEPDEIGDLKEISAKPAISLVDTPQTIDLAAGESDAAPISVAEAPADAGLYNALFWEIGTAGGNSSISGQTMVLRGTATKDNRQVDFDLKLNQPTAYLCGEFVGEDRKGIVKQSAAGEVEMTFHFDHLFGDGELPQEDELNQKALGFQPLADITEENSWELDGETLANELSPENYQKLTKAISGLGHVGEGHCSIVE